MSELSYKEICQILLKDKENLLIRGDRRVEWLCEHDIGHTVSNPNDWGKFTFSHGCDGCCSKVSSKLKQNP